MHGTSAADGTDWAISHSGSRLLQSTALMFREVLTRSDRAPRRQSLSVAAATRRGSRAARDWGPAILLDPAVR